MCLWDYAYMGYVGMCVCVCKTDGSLCRLEVMALRTRSVRFFRLTMAMSMRLWTSGWARASSGVTWYGSVLWVEENGEWRRL